MYAICAIDYRAPLAIEDKFLGNPVTVAAIITYKVRIVTRRIGYITPLVHRIGHVNRLVVCKCNRFLRQLCSGLEKFRAFRVGVPAHKLITCTDTCGKADSSSVTDTEVHCLVFRSPVQRLVGAGIRTQENTVLDLTPLGIDGDVTHRHFAPRTRCRTTCIHVPAFKDVPLLSSGKRGNCVCVQLRDCCAMRDVWTLKKKMPRPVLKRVAITVNIVAIKIRYLELVTSIKEIKVVFRNTITIRILVPIGIINSRSSRSSPV